MFTLPHRRTFALRAIESSDGPSDRSPADEGSGDGGSVAAEFFCVAQFTASSSCGTLMPMRIARVRGIEDSLVTTYPTASEPSM